jgi:amidophosphoribosyltransferase
MDAMQNPSDPAGQLDLNLGIELQDDLEGDTLREECGVFGIFGHPEAAAITALGLHALQHRGQEGRRHRLLRRQPLPLERRLGLVGDTFSRREVIERLPGIWPSAMSATPRPAPPSCATCSRCSPSSMPAVSPSATTAISPTG